MAERLNKLTAKHEYSRNNRGNLPLPIQMQLSKKPKHFAAKITFLKSKLNFERFEKKKPKKTEPHSLSISEIINSERRGYLNA